VLLLVILGTRRRRSGVGAVALLTTDHHDLRAASIELEARLGHANLGLLDEDLRLANLHLGLLHVDDRLAHLDPASHLLLNGAPLRAFLLALLLGAINNALSASITRFTPVVEEWLCETRHCGIYIPTKIFSATFLFPKFPLLFPQGRN